VTVYRRVHISFWQDPDVLELTPEQKYFYLYLMTNSKTRQCGCYEISKKVMQLETGYNDETIDKLISYFINAGKIEYCNDSREILLKNWHKHNSSKSPRVKACIEKEVETIKNPNFKKYCMDTLCIEYSNTMYTEQQKEKEKEEEEEQEEAEKCPHEQIKELYNTTCNLPKVRTISTERKKHIKARWKQYNYSLSIFEELFNKTAASAFLNGKNDRGWSADFDWLMNENNMAKVLEGKYEGKNKTLDRRVIDS